MQELVELAVELELVLSELVERLPQRRAQVDLQTHLVLDHVLGDRLEHLLHVHFVLVLVVETREELERLEIVRIETARIVRVRVGLIRSVSTEIERRVDCRVEIRIELIKIRTSLVCVLFEKIHNRSVRCFLA